jgi:hypothetical protein
MVHTLWRQPYTAKIFKPSSRNLRMIRDKKFKDLCEKQLIEIRVYLGCLAWVDYFENESYRKERRDEKPDCPNNEWAY